MATTTAAITLTSTDLLTDSLSLSATQTLYQAGTTTGLDQARMFRTEVPTGDVYDLLDATARGANTAAKVYIKNIGNNAGAIDKSIGVKVLINSIEVGVLYGGDWLMMPVTVVDKEDVEVQPATDDVVILEYTMFYEEA